MFTWVNLKVNLYDFKRKLGVLNGLTKHNWFAILSHQKLSTR